MKKQLFTIAVAVLALASCSKAPHFEVSGIIYDGQGEVITLEQTSLKGNIPIDSTTIKRDGSFSLKVPSPEYPDIYLLRTNGKKFYLVVDSTEHIELYANMQDFSLCDSIVGSEETKQVTALRKSLLTNSIEEHRELQRATILANPRSMVAYFALMQTKGGAYLLNPNVKEDLVCYRAVATALNTFMPNYYRGKVLYQQVLDFINNQKAIANNEFMLQMIAESENTFLDITLPDEYGIEQSLSQYKGKVILLDFSAVGMDHSAEYIFELRDIYNTYHKRGLEIYSVSGDYNHLLWQNTAENLPWTTVRSEQGVNTQCFVTYNVQHLPTVFVLNKKGEVIGRYATFEEVKKGIEECLR